MGYLQTFSYYTSLIMGGIHQKMLNRARKQDEKPRKSEFNQNTPLLSTELAQRKNYRMKGEKEDPGVKRLDDPYLPEYSLNDFPRIKRLHGKHFSAMPEILPFWAKRTTREWIREKYAYPLCQKIDERAVASFNFKIVSMSHTVPDVPRFVHDGTLGIMDEIRNEIKNLSETEFGKINTRNAMILCPENNDFKTFDDFFNAFAEQQRFIIEHTTRLNNMAGEAYTYLRPTPLLSTAIRGAIENALDVTRGGAHYNTSGTFNIGLSDVVDSLMVIKTLVYDEKKITFSDLKTAIDTNFKNDPTIHAMVMHKVPRFGSGSDEAVDMANRVTSLIHDTYKKN